MKELFYSRLAVAYCTAGQTTKNSLIYKNIIYIFYSSTVTIVCRRNTESKSSHISFCAFLGPFLWSSATAGEHTRGADRSACVISGSPPSLERPAGLCLQSKITDLILSFQVPWGSMNILFAYVYFCLWLVIRTYILPFFFSVICWSYLRTEISVILSLDNKLNSRHHLIYSLSCENDFVDAILRPHWTC